MLRIVAGEFRGRRIPVPKVAGLRPTGERVREALFSILGDRLPGAVVLDAYAGSGALGFEALSRGAAQAIFIEADARAAFGLEATAGMLGVERRCRIVRGSVLGALGRGLARGPFDLLLADPPWSLREGPQLVRCCAQGASGGGGGLIAPEGVLVVERSARDAPIPSFGELVRFRTARYGDTALDFFASDSRTPAKS